jgi:hypothetical protein
MGNLLEAPERKHKETSSMNDSIADNGLQEQDELKRYSSRTADKFVVRMPKGMRDRIAQTAKAYHRSMNSEIVSRLESSLKKDHKKEKDLKLSPPTESVEQPISVNELEKKVVLRMRELPREKLEALITLID